MKFTSNLAKYFNHILEDAGISAPSYIGEFLVAALVFIVAIFLGWAVYFIFERYFARWAEKTKTRLDDEILKNIKAPIYFFVILVGAYYALETLSFLDDYSFLISGVFSFAQIVLAALIVIRVINVLIAWYAEKNTKRKKKVSNHLLFILRKILKLVVIVFAFLFVLAAFNVDLTGAIVGLGVAGIAIGFALQNILSDLFSAFTIYFDKPFELGDFVILGNDMGTIKKIGMMSTRITTLQGEELVVSNKELVTTRIRNFKKMQKRRINFTFGVTYGTPLSKLKKIPDIVRKIIEDVELASPDRVHFKQFGDFSLNFDVVYYIDSSDYNKYMDTQQEINFRIKEAFEKEGIEMAFPTQTIFLKKPN